MRSNRPYVQIDPSVIEQARQMDLLSYLQRYEPSTLKRVAGNILLKRGKPVPDTSLRDTENVPLVQDIDSYFAREVLPYAPDAWIDHSKTKVGYEIPMTRYFYEYQAPEAVEDIVARITALEQDISAGLAELFHKEG